MARITYVKKAAKPHTCQKCGAAIEIGDSYKHVSPRAGSFARGRKLIRCSACPTWKRSELTSSKLADAYAAQEQFDDDESRGSFTSLDEFLGLVEELADQIEGCADGYEESADNIESGFGHEVPMSEELREKADQVREWAENVRSACSDFDEFDEDAARVEVIEDLYDEETPEEDRDDDDIRDGIQQKLAEWNEEISEAISAALNEEPF